MNVEDNTKVWFTSDTHFGAQRTLDMSKRPFKTIEEMDETMIRNWNSVVGKHDTVFHLGDFGDYKVAEKLNGRITLICGNYERSEPDKVYENAKYFKSIYGSKSKQWIQYIKFYYNDHYRINMCHEPNFIKNIKLTENNINLFGHVHKLCMVKSYGINVGMDCHNFYPIDMETVLFYHNGILNYYDDEVFK